MDGAVWGATLRSPHPYARIVSIDTSAALAIPGVHAVLTADDVPGAATYGLITADQPVFASDYVRYVGEPIAVVAADHQETCRRAVAAIAVEYDVLTPLLDPEAAIAGDARPDPSERQRAASPAHRPRRPRRHRRRRRRGHVPHRHAGPGVPRARSGARRSRRGRARRRVARRHPVDARGPPPDRRLPRPRRGAGAPRARRRRRCVRRPRGHQPAGAHVPAGPAPRPAGADALQPGRELPRSRPSSSGDDLDAPPRHRRRRDRQDRGPLRARRRRLRVDVVGGAAQRDHPHAGPVPMSQRRRRRLRGAHEPPAVRGDARLRRRPGVLRPREPDGPPGRGVRPRSGRHPPAQRHDHRRLADHRPGRRERRPGGALHQRDGRAAASLRRRRRRRVRPDATAWRRRADHRRR